MGARAARRRSAPSRRGPTRAPARRSRGCRRSSRPGSRRSGRRTTVAEILVADRVAQVDHPAERPAGDDDVVDGRRVTSPTETSSVASSTVRSSPANARARPSSSSSPEIAVRKPTRPWLTPSTGTPVPRNRPSARSIVPSPPSTTARSACVVVDDLDAELLGDTLRARSAARLAPSRTISVIDLTGGIGDPPVQVGRDLWVLSVDEVEDELMVSLRAGQARVYDPARLSPGREALRRPRATTRRRTAVIAHDALRRLRRPASNCGLTSTSACQPGAARRSAGGSASFTEMNETSQVTSCGANGSSVSERAFTRSITTRASRRTLSCSCP